MNVLKQCGFLGILRRFFCFAVDRAGFPGLILTLLVLSACAFNQPQDPLEPTATMPMATPTEREPIPTETEIPTETPTALPSPTPAPVAIAAANLSRLEILQRMVGHGAGVTDVAISADNALIASSSEDGTVRVWNASDGSERFVLPGHQGIVNSVAFSPDGLVLASGGDDRTVRIWDAQSGEAIQVIRSGLIGRVLGVEYSPDGNLLAAAGHYCYIELRQASTGILRRTLAQPGCVSRYDGSVTYWGMDFSSDGAYIATGDAQTQSDLGSIHHWVVDEYTRPDLVKGNRLLVRDLAYSPLEEKLAVALVGGYEFWLVDIESREIEQIYPGHTLRVNAVDFSPNGNLIGSASRDRSLRLWDPVTGEALTVLEGHQDAVNSLVFSADGSLIVSGSDDGSVILWGLPD